MVRTTEAPGSPPVGLRTCLIADIMRRTRPVDAPPPLSAATSSPELPRRRTVRTTEAPGSPPEGLRTCSIADIMRRTQPMDASPPPVAREWQEAVVCGECGSGDRDEELLLCDQCDGGRHTYCLSPILADVPLGPWLCPDCVPPPSSRTISSAFHSPRRARRPVDAPPPPVASAWDEVLVCGECGSGDRDDELLLCGLCDQSRHTYCLQPILAAVPLGPWHCPDCVPPPSRTIISFPVDESKIIEFFGIQEDPQPENRRLPQDAKRRTKKKRRMLPFVPVEDRVQRLRQMASLATALTSSNMDFSNELTYMPNMAPKSSNQAKLEEGPVMQVLSEEDKETIELCRSMQKRGECPPLVVVFDSFEGFTVQADADIKDMTFIAELTGDVDYWKNRENDDGDSFMTLLWTADPSKKLVICPDKRGNIGRFISGINNHTPDGKKKQNVKSVRYNIDGESHVLLVACRAIAHGEKLCFDYNEHEYAYDTYDFI